IKICRTAQTSLHLQKVPEMFFSQHNCPAIIGNRNVLSGTAGAQLTVATLDVYLFLVEEPISQVVQDFVYAVPQLMSRHLGKILSQRRVLEFLQQPFRQLVGMIFNKTY